MWRVEADVELGIDDHMRLYKDRINPLENLRDEDFFARYRFPKEVVTDLLDIIGPALERNTRRYVTGLHKFYSIHIDLLEI